MKKLYLKTKLSKNNKPYTALYFFNGNREIFLSFDSKILANFIRQSDLADLVEGKEIILMEVNN